MATQSKSILSDQDLELITKLFLYSKELHILNMEVWFYRTFHHGLCGREIQCHLAKSSLTLCKDREGKGFYELCIDLSRKNHQGGSGDNTTSKQAGCIQCQSQVLAVCMLLKHLNPAYDRLFQRPKRNLQPRDPVWFKNAPLGKNTLDKMMRNLSVKVGTSKVYANHCLRATLMSCLRQRNRSENFDQKWSTSKCNLCFAYCVGGCMKISVTVLQENGFFDNDIMSVTGHRNAQPLLSYSRPGEKQQQKMAVCLDSTTGSSSTAISTSASSLQLEPDQVNQLFSDFTPTDLAIVTSPGSALIPAAPDSVDQLLMLN